MLNHLFCAVIECQLKKCLVICCNKKNMFDPSLAVLTEMLQPTASRAESLTTSFSEHPSFIQEYFDSLACFAYSVRALLFLRQLSFHCWGISYRGTLNFLSGLTSSPDFMLCMKPTINYKEWWHFWLPEFSLNPTDLAGVGEMWQIHLGLQHLCTAPFLL